MSRIIELGEYLDEVIDSNIEFRSKSDEKDAYAPTRPISRALTSPATAGAIYAGGGAYMAKKSFDKLSAGQKDRIGQQLGKMAGAVSGRRKVPAALRNPRSGRILPKYVKRGKIGAIAGVGALAGGTAMATQKLANVLQARAAEGRINKLKRKVRKADALGKTNKAERLERKLKKKQSRYV